MVVSDLPLQISPIDREKISFKSATWWSGGGSNPGPSHCEGELRTLPAFQKIQRLVAHEHENAGFLGFLCSIHSATYCYVLPRLYTLLAFINVRK